MLRHGILLAVLLQVTIHSVITEKQQLKLSDSYLPVAMQVISHLTDQMSYEAKDDPTVRPTTKPATRPTTPKIEYVWYIGDYLAKPDGRWAMNYGLKSVATQFDKLSIQAIPGTSNNNVPGSPSNNVLEKNLLPLEHQYLKESNCLTDKEQLLGTNYLQDYPHVKLDKNTEIQSYSSQNLEYNTFRTDDQDVANLQRLSQNVRDFIGLASEPGYKKFGDAWEETKARPNLPKLMATNSKDSKDKLEKFNELLNRESTIDNLSEFNGCSEKLLKELAESWKGGARAQLRFVLAKLVTTHRWHNRSAGIKARALLEELSIDSSSLSADISRLKPLVYTI